MRVLVTGGAGFIGSYMAEYHIKKGDQVYVLDNLSTGCKDNLAGFCKNKNFTLFQEDVLTWNRLENIVVQTDRIYHLAAVVGMFTVLREPSRTLATNIVGTERLLRAALNTKTKPQIIIASSSEVYGSKTCNVGQKENDQLTMNSSAKLRWNYAISKLAGEYFGITYNREHNIPVLLIRFFNTTGPRQKGRYGMVLPRFVKQAISGKPITVFGDGTQSRCFCDARDIVKNLDLLANNHNAYGQVFNLGNDQGITIMDLAKLVKKIANSKSVIKTIPYEEAYGGEYEDIACRKPNLDKLNDYIVPKFEFALEKTIKDLVDYCSKNEHNK